MSTPDVPRSDSPTCNACGASIGHRRAGARTCSGRCRVELHRRTGLPSLRPRRRRGRKPRPVSATTIARRQAIPLSDLWRTPRAVIEAARLVAGVAAWELDAAAYESDRVAPMWLGQGSPIAVDALAVAWPPVPIWVNPPYSVKGGPLGRWVDRCVEAQDRGSTVALLVPMSSSSAWFDRALSCAELYRFRRRIAFVPPAGLDWTADGSRHDPALFVFRPGRAGAGSLSTLTIPEG